MKKTLTLVFVLFLSILELPSSFADNNGGYAVVNPETGVVHGVIVASSSDPFGNGGVMPMEYMGCPSGCLIVQQSTADKNGNVGGIHGPNVTYDQNRNVFQVTESDITQNQTVIESTSGTSSIETEILVSRSIRNYEFGIQDFTNNTGQFQMNEVSPPQNTSAQIFANTKEYNCIDREMLCTSSLSSSSTTLVDESVKFNERSTSNQVLQKVISEARNKIRQQLDKILSMLEKWIID
jgi:hypothetical protein